MFPKSELMIYLRIVSEEHRNLFMHLLGTLFLHLLMLSSTKNPSLAAEPLQSRDYQIPISNHLIPKIS